jgi:hypothetical protein
VAGTAAVLRGRLRQRVSRKENSNGDIVTLTLCYYCEKHSFCVSGINHCDRYTCTCSLQDPSNIVVRLEGIYDSQATNMKRKASHEAAIVGRSDPSLKNS